MSFTNLYTEAIKEITFRFFSYDAGGFPVKVQFGTDSFFNGYYDLAVKGNETKSAQWTPYSSGNPIKTVKALVKDITYYNGETCRMQPMKKTLRLSMMCL